MLLRLALIFIFAGVALSCSKPRTAQQSAPPASPTATQTPTIPDGWQRMEVHSKFVFYMPSDMRQVDEPGDHAGPHAGFTNGHLHLNYGYATEDLCAPNEETLPLQSQYNSAETNTAGKRAVLRTWTRDDWSFITLCFYDIGDGKTRLHFGAISKDSHDLEVARQVFASIQFLGDAT
jgi:hypothetical protein